MLKNLFLSLLIISLSLGLRPFLELTKTSEMDRIIREFHEILEESEQCTTLRNNALTNLNPRNHSTHLARIQRDLFDKYIDLAIAQNLPDVFVKSLLGMYCRVKIEQYHVEKSMRTPKGLRGNFTWYFTDDVAENYNYHMAKHNEQVFRREYETERWKRILEMRREMEKIDAKEIGLETLKSFYRTSAFLITISLALCIQHALHVYYGVEEEGGEEEEVEEGERGQMPMELAQIAVLFFSLVCILVTLRGLEEQ